MTCWICGIRLSVDAWGAIAHLRRVHGVVRLTEHRDGLAGYGYRCLCGHRAQSARAMLDHVLADGDPAHHFAEARLRPEGT